MNTPLLEATNIKEEDEEIDFGLNTSRVLFTDEESKNICLIRCLISSSESIFYVSLITALIIVGGFFEWF